ncbi:hypothetical protein CKM354_000181900 [Cercospora kikuchii]|uniref:Polynucleotide 5'-hydroxyl-kinase GRC3 n=1 Tax=Cercospora kikuchii TaxID=84275 RepID=A0A9P3FC81_9PEZI|nr:polynucleotide 5'-hydroxyl-kinase [Cercospora kikuchii]GIZ38402.1 hypothetical protein CKM354_000181900 [Cercospora kikuchii]
MAAAKRKAREAFGRNKSQDLRSSVPQLSAFAAARAISSSADRPESASSTCKPKDETGIGAIEELSAHETTGSTQMALDDSMVSMKPERGDAAKINVTLSTIKQNAIDLPSDDAMVISMRQEESVTFLGDFNLQVLNGVVSVYGSMLHANRGVQRVYAPATSPLPVITARKPETLIRVTSVFSGLASIEPLSPMFRDICSSAEGDSRSFRVLRNSRDDPMGRAITPLEIDDGTRKVISQLNARLDAGGQTPRIMAIGGKSAGKSTFNRILCNTVTSRADKSSCAYIDLDPGQPEFGPPGQLSLIEVTAPILGPAFTHQASTRNSSYRLIRSHTIASTTFKDDPDHYLACAVDLLSYAPKNTPIIINSCGWVNGLGASTIVSLASKLSISDLVSLDSIETEVLSEVAAVVGNVPLRISRRQRQQALRTPAELRAMQTMAYFHQKSSLSSIKWIAKPINEIRPWIVSYSPEGSGIAAVLSYGQAPHPDFLGEVLDGSIVAITVIDDQAFDQEAIHHTATENIPYLPPGATGHTPPLDPRRSHCIGLALVRGIDTESKTLQLVTPVAGSEIEAIADKQVVLVRGGFDPPEWAYLEDWYATGGAVDTEERPWVSFQEQAGIEGSIWRMRHPPMAKDVR